MRIGNYLPRETHVSANGVPGRWAWAVGVCTGRAQVWAPQAAAGDAWGGSNRTLALSHITVGITCSCSVHWNRRLPRPDKRDPTMIVAECRRDSAIRSRRVRSSRRHCHPLGDSASIADTAHRAEPDYTTDTASLNDPAPALDQRRYGSSTKCVPVGNLCWHPHDRTADWARFWGRNDGPQ